MESKLRDAVKGIEHDAKFFDEGVIYDENLKVLLDLARSYLSAIEKGVPEKIGICGTVNIFDEKKMLGWNACHDAFLPLLVEKEKEIARLSKEVNDLDHGLHKHQDPHWKMWERVLAEKRKEAMEFRDIACTQSKEIEDLESQLSKKTPTMEKLIEIIDSAIDKHFEKDMHTIPWVKFYGNPINFKQELADILIAKWGGKDEITV